MATTAHGSPLALSVPTGAPLHVRCSPPAYGAPSCTCSPQRCPDGRRPPPPSLRCYEQDDLGPSPTKASLGHASSRAKPLRRLELFPDPAAKRPKPDGCARPPRVGAEAPATATSSGSDGLSSSSVLEDDGEEELSLRSRHGSSVLEEAGCTHVGGQGLEDAGGCGSPLGGGDAPLPPLALAAELPEGIRGQLHPTPLEDMLQEDRRLAAGGAAQLPADALLLACPSQTPWVKRLRNFGGRGMQLLEAEQHPEQPARIYRRNAAGLEEAPQGPPLFARVTVPELEVPREDPVEERLRRDIVDLLWEPDLVFEQRNWTGVDCWHNMSAQYYAARQKTTWVQARAAPGAVGQGPPTDFVNALLA